MKVHFPRYSLIDILTERLAFKAGLLLSKPEILSHLNSYEQKQIIESSEEHLVILRPEDFEQIFFCLLKNIGNIHPDYEPDPLGISIYHKYKNTALENVVPGVLKILGELIPYCIEDAKQKGATECDPTPLFKESFKQFGKDGITILYEFLQCQHSYQMDSPLHNHYSP